MFPPEDTLKKLFGRVSPGAPPALSFEAYQKARQKEQLDAAKPYLQPENYYLFDLHIVQAPEGGVIVSSPHLKMGSVDFMMGGRFAGVHGLALAVPEFTDWNFGLRGQVHFKDKGTSAYINGEDDYLGLPPGDGYQIVFIPKGCAWQPPALPPAEKKPPRTCVLLHPPKA